MIELKFANGITASADESCVFTENRWGTEGMEQLVENPAQKMVTKTHGDIEITIRKDIVILGFKDAPKDFAGYVKHVEKSFDMIDSGFKKNGWAFLKEEK